MATQHKFLSGLDLSVALPAEAPLFPLIFSTALPGPDGPGAGRGLDPGSVGRRGGGRAHAGRRALPGAARSPDPHDLDDAGRRRAPRRAGRPPRASRGGRSRSTSPSAVRRFFDAEGPRLLVLVETELWPAVLNEARRRSIPVLLANARLSARSAARYRRASRVLRRVRSRLSRASSRARPPDAERFAAIGVPADARDGLRAISSSTAPSPPRRPSRPRRAPSRRGGPILVAGSAAGDEIPLFLDVRAPPRGRISPVFLVLAPAAARRLRRRRAARRGRRAARRTPEHARRRRAGGRRRRPPPRHGGRARRDVLRSATPRSSAARSRRRAATTSSSRSAPGRPSVVGPSVENIRETVDAAAGRGLSRPRRRVRRGRARAAPRGRRGPRTGGRRRPSPLRVGRGGVGPGGPCRPRALRPGAPPGERPRRAGRALRRRRRRPPLALYRRGLLPVRRAARPVLSVGNVAAGGTGKTPFVRWLAGELVARGRRPSILTRGYGRASRGTVVVSDGAGALASARDAGDEPALLARALPTVPIVAEANRSRGARRAEEIQPAIALHLLDDGFSHVALARDLDIVLLDATAPDAGGALLPAGRLREPLASLARADILVVTKTEQADVSPGPRGRCALRSGRAGLSRRHARPRHPRRHGARRRPGGPARRDVRRRRGARATGRVLLDPRAPEDRAGGRALLPGSRRVRPHRPRPDRARRGGVRRDGRRHDREGRRQAGGEARAARLPPSPSTCPILDPGFVAEALARLARRPS